MEPTDAADLISEIREERAEHAAEDRFRDRAAMLIAIMAMLLAPMQLTQALLPHLRAQARAQVVFVGSVLGAIGLMLIVFEGALDLHLDDVAEVELVSHSIDTALATIGGSTDAQVTFQVTVQ